MTAPLRVLIIEEHVAEVSHLVQRLREAGFDPDWQQVATPEEFLAVVDASVDVVLSDYTLSQFNALAALHLLQTRDLDVPLIVLARTGDESRVVECMRLGAVDYLLKDRLARLGDAVQSALEVRQLRREKRIADEALRRMNRAYRALSDCNQAVVRATDELSLLRRICQLLVDVGGYRMAWVGYAEHDEAQTVSPRAWAGPQADYLDTVRISWADDAYGQGPTGRSIRLKKTCVARFIASDPAYGPWREDALIRGFQSSISLPLIIDDQAIGALGLYSEHPNAFDPAEVALLEELAGDLAFGIDALRTRQAHQEAERALRESEERYRVLFEGIDDAIFVHDEEANILDVNEAACRRLGYTRDELLRMKTTDIDAPAYAAGFRERWEKQLAEGGLSQINGVHIARDGREIIIDVNTRLIDYQGKPAVLAVVRDVTERHRMQEAEHKQRQLAEALSDVARIVNSALDLDDVLDAILVTVERVLPYDAVNLMLLENGRLRVARHRGYAERGLTAWIEEIDWPLDRVENIGEMAETGRPAAIPNVQTYTGWVDVPETRWVRSYVGAPIRIDRQVIGFLNLDSATDGQYTQEHAEQLRVFADHAAIALRNARLYEAVQCYAAELEQRVAERTRELRQSEALYRAIVEDHPDLVCRYTPEGILTFVNTAYARFFGKTTEELIGQSFMPLVFPDDRLALEAQLALLTPERPVVETEHRAYTPSGDLRWLQWTNRMVLDAAGQSIALQAVGRDVTERHQFEESLQKALAREVELGELKSRFVSMVSHEFRNPLAVMQTNVDLLRRYNDRLTPEQRQKQLDTLQAFIHRMSDLLDDVLTVSRAESGRLELRPEHFDLLALCQEIVEEVRSTASPDLLFHLHADDDCRVMADPKLIRQAIGNLISNAAKYSRPTGVVNITLRRLEETVEVVVADQGIGIPRADQRRLFEGFHRASNVGQIPGTGLGLMIARLCVERHGGSIAFESEENVGSTFILTIPCVPRTEPPEAVADQ